MRLEPAAARAWLARLLIFAAVLLAVEVPLTVAFARPVPLGWLGFCVFLDATFLVDALLSWRWPLRDEALDDEAAAAQRRPFGRTRRVARRRRRGAHAVVGLWLRAGAGAAAPAVAAPFAAARGRLAEAAGDADRALISMILTFLLCAHWVACLWWLIGRSQLDDATLPRPQAGSTVTTAAPTTSGAATTPPARAPTGARAAGARATPRRAACSLAAPTRTTPPTAAAAAAAAAAARWSCTPPISRPSTGRLPS